MRLYEGENRAIGIALLVSIALHVLLLFALPGLRDSQRRSIAREPLIARLMHPRSEPVMVPRTEPVTVPVSPPALPETRTSVPTPTPIPPKARLAPNSTPIPLPRPASIEPVTATVPAAPLGPAAPAAPSDQVAAVPVARVEPQRGAPASDAADAGTLAQYRLSIITAARRYKRYPRVALDNNWQGRVEVRMAIGATGAITELSVRSSTGHPVLDQQALEMIERAKATAQVPPALRGREFVVDIPVIFSLKDPDA